MIGIAAPAKGAGAIFSTSFQNFGKTETFSGSDKHNLGKIRNFRAVTMIKNKEDNDQRYVPNAEKKFKNIGEDSFFRQHH